MCKLRLEGLSLILVLEVSSLHPPSSDGLGDPVEELSYARLTFICSEPPSEVFRCDDIRRGLRPEGGSLDLLLLKYYLTVMVGDCCVSKFPFDSVVWVDSWFSVTPLAVVLSRRDFRSMMYYQYLIYLLALFSFRKPRKYAYTTRVRIKEICTDWYKNLKYACPRLFGGSDSSDAMVSKTAEVGLFFQTDQYTVTERQYDGRHSGRLGD